MKWAVILVIIIVIIFFIFLKKKQNQLAKNFRREFSGKKIHIIDKNAIYVAKLSDGYSHFRGTGFLVLTREELYFERQLDNKVIRIPTRSITEIDKTRRLAGQSPGGLMLKISFTTNEGENDSIAWKVKHLDQWIKKINSILNDIT